MANYRIVIDDNRGIVHDDPFRVYGYRNVTEAIAAMNSDCYEDVRALIYTLDFPKVKADGRFDSEVIEIENPKHVIAMKDYKGEVYSPCETCADSYDLPLKKTDSEEWPSIKDTEYTS